MIFNEIAQRVVPGVHSIVQYGISSFKEELSDLKELKEDGTLDDEEFKTCKEGLIKKHYGGGGSE